MSELVGQYVTSGAKHCLLYRGKSLPIGPVETSNTIGWSEAIGRECRHT